MRITKRQPRIRREGAHVSLPMALLALLLAALSMGACSKNESEYTTRVTINPDTLEINGTTIVIDSVRDGEIHVKF